MVMSTSAVEKLSSIRKTDPVQVYCFSGGRAEAAKRILASLGYEKVTNIGGVPSEKAI
jgi:rhodanese-related sulfurtransferase